MATNLVRSVTVSHLLGRDLNVMFFVAAQYVSDVPAVRAGVQGEVRAPGNQQFRNDDHHQHQFSIQCRRRWVSASLGACNNLAQGTTKTYYTHLPHDIP